MEPVITFTANDRLHYMIRVLESWKAVRGIDRARMIFQCEPHPGMAALIGAETGYAAQTLIRVNDRQAGCEANTGLALAAGFATGADFVILGEDDGIVTADLLEYMTWAAGRYRDDKDVFAVCTFQDAPPGPLDEVRKPSRQPVGLDRVSPADVLEEMLLPPLDHGVLWRVRRLHCKATPHIEPT